MAKNFKSAASSSAPDVYGALIGSAQEEQKAPDAQTALEAQEAQATRGRKGVKMPRINMAFRPSNLDYIRVMAAIRGQSMTQYVNAIIEIERNKNGDAYQAAKQIVDGADH